MVIGIDAGALSVSDDRLKVGVWRVTKQALLHLASIDTKNNYRFYAFAPIEQGIVEAFGGRAQMVRLPKMGWSKVWLPIELKKHPVDVYLGFAQSLPYLITSYNIGFIYDLGFLYHPEAYGTSAMSLKKQTDTLVRRADHIITISHATKSDLTREYGLSKENITVAYPGVDASFSPAGEKYVGPNPYFLFVGSLNKAKDIPTLLESFAKFLEKKLDPRLRGDDKKGRGDDNTYDLYLVGGDYWPDPAIDETIEKLHLEKRVKTIGFVSDEELPKYYRGGAAFVTTALQEGFCLPAAEAMACGTPVVSLPQGALREIVGKGGIITTKLEEGMRKMMDKTIRPEFSKKAIMQANKFRWDKFAQEILEQITNFTRPPLAKAKGVAL